MSFREGEPAQRGLALTEAQFNGIVWSVNMLNSRRITTESADIFTESRPKTELKLPDIVFLGPQRTGTSWLYRYFRHHPETHPPEGVKETRFFDNRHDKGLKWYASHFDHASESAHIVEVASTYFYAPEAPERIARDLGDIRVCCTLRNPVDRLQSLYLHRRRKGLTNKTFLEALAAEEVFTASSRYGSLLERWFDRFGRENVSVFFLETLANDGPEAFASGITEQLGLASFEVPEELHQKVGHNRQPKSYLRAKAGQLIGGAFRSVRLYPVINAAKKLGLKEWFFGSREEANANGDGDDKKQTVDASALRPMRGMLLEEVERLEELLASSFEDWKASIEAL